MPAMQLKIVLLPDPFGPISPRISPSFTSNDTFDTAVKPSNILVRPETVRRATRRAHLLRSPGGRSPPEVGALARVGVPRGQRQHRVGGLDRRRPRDLGHALHVLHHDGGGALVLAGHLVA